MKWLADGVISPKITVYYKTTELCVPYVTTTIVLLAISRKRKEEEKKKNTYPVHL